MTAQIADELGRIPMSQRLGVTLRRATDYASAQHHAEVTLEHLLLALTEDVDAEGVLTSSGVPIASLKSDASQHIANLDQHGADGSTDAISISADLRRILEAAAAAARGRRNAINGAIVLAAIVGDGSSAAAHILSAHGMTFEHAIRALQQVPPAAEQAPPAQPPRRPTEQAATAGQPPQRQPLHQTPVPPAEHAPRDPNSNDAILAEARERVKQRATQGQAARRGPHAPAHPDETAFAAEQSVQAPPSPQPVVRDRDEPPTGQKVARVGERTQPPTQVREQTAPPPQPAPPAPPNNPGQPPSAQREQQGDAQPGNHPVRQSESWAPPPAPPRGAPQPPRPYRPPPPISPEPSPQPLRQNRPEDVAFGNAHPSTRQHGQPARPGEARHEQQSAPPHPQGAHPGPPQQRPPGAPPWADGETTPSPGPTHQQTRQPAPNRPPIPHEPRNATGRQGGPAPQRKRAKPGRVQAGQLAENIPRKMRVGITSTAEVRIAKADVKALAEGLEGGGAAYKHDVQITKAMSVRLRAPDGGFFIETASPETQWTENVLGMMADDYASWRWNITPKQRGRKRLQLVISARTMGSDGVTAETALPDQVFEVSVKTNYARTAARTGGWITAAIVGGLFARFGEQMWDTVQALAKTLSGP